jgi:hypothetical protein
MNRSCGNCGIQEGKCTNKMWLECHDKKPIERILAYTGIIYTCSLWSYKNWKEQEPEKKEVGSLTGSLAGSQGPEQKDKWEILQGILKKYSSQVGVDWNAVNIEIKLFIKDNFIMKDNFLTKKGEPEAWVERFDDIFSEGNTHLVVRTELRPAWNDCRNEMKSFIRKEMEERDKIINDLKEENEYHIKTAKALTENHAREKIKEREL